MLNLCPLTDLMCFVLLGVSADYFVTKDFILCFRGLQLYQLQIAVLRKHITFPKDSVTCPDVAVLLLLFVSVMLLYVHNNRLFF